MKNIYALIFMSFCSSIYCCQNTNVPSQPVTLQEQIIYLNSFESPTDTVGWKGEGSYRFENQAAPSCGKQSLFVAGGCIAPHAYWSLPSSKFERRLYIRLWGKKYPAYGGVILASWDPTPIMIGVQIKDSIWTQYQSDTLIVPLNRTIQLEISSGGKGIEGGVLVDKLEIVKVK